MPSDISILLVNWNTRDLTLRCLDSLPDGAAGSLAYEVVVVDNGSGDGSVEALERRPDVGRLIVNAENRGYAAAVNQAYGAATGELVLLLNSDVVLRPGSLNTLVRFLRERPEAAGVAPLYLNPDGTRQQHYYRLPTFWTLVATSNGLLRRIRPFTDWIRSYRMLDDDFSRPRPVPQPSASCLLLRRSCLPAGRIFEERYPVYFNDVALARELAAAGASLWMTPEAEVLHDHGASGWQLGPKLKRQHLGALIRYLSATEPRHRVAAFQAIALAQGALMRMLRMHGALPLGELWAAVRGDPGPLPRAPSSSRPTLRPGPADVDSRLRVGTDGATSR